MNNNKLNWSMLILSFLILAFIGLVIYLIVSQCVDYYQENDTKIKYLKNHINSLNPKNIMKRGYSIVYNKKDQVVKDVKNIKDKEKLNIKLYTGEIEVQNLKSTKK